MTAPKNPRARPNEAGGVAVVTKPADRPVASTSGVLGACGGQLASEIRRPSKAAMALAIAELRYKAKDLSDTAAVNRHNLKGFREEFHEGIKKRANRLEGRAKHLERVIAWLAVQ